MADADSRAWKVWCDFCDAAQVAPDTLRSAEDLAERFTQETGQPMAPDQVRVLMENAR